MIDKLIPQIQSAQQKKELVAKFNSYPKSKLSYFEFFRMTKQDYGLTFHNSTSGSPTSSTKMKKMDTLGQESSANK